MLPKIIDERGKDDRVAQTEPAVRSGIGHAAVAAFRAHSEMDFLLNMRIERIAVLVTVLQIEIARALRYQISEPVESTPARVRARLEFTLDQTEIGPECGDELSAQRRLVRKFWFGLLT